MHAVPVPLLAEEIRTRLEENAVPGRAVEEKRYLKSDLEHVGVPLPAMRKLVQGFVRGHRDLTRDDVAELALELWSRPVHEHRSVALLILGGYVGLLEAEDTELLERLLRECRSWGHVDLLAPFVAGRLLLEHPRAQDDIRRWAADREQWVRRGGILSFLLALRQEQDFPRWFPVFGEVVDPLLEDDRFFVRKAIGWALREGAKHHPGPVADWLGDRLDRVSGLTLREAARRLPDADTERLLASYARLNPRGTRRGT